MRIRIRRIMIPTLILLGVACLIEVPLGQTTIFGDEVILYDTLFRALISVPILIYFYREDSVLRGKEKWSFKTFLQAFASGFLLSILGTFLFSLLHVPGYEESYQSLLTGSLWLQLLVLMVASPLLEELFFRGVLYQRLKDLMSPLNSAILSSLIFGIYHANFAQAVYGFFMGLVLCLFMEKTESVKPAVVFHAAANFAGIVLNFF